MKKKKFDKPPILDNQYSVPEFEKNLLTTLHKLKQKNIEDGIREKRDLEKQCSAMAEVLYQNYLFKHHTHKNNLDLFWLAFQLREISIVKKNHFARKCKKLTHEGSLIEAAKMIGKKYSGIYVTRGNNLIGEGPKLYDAYKRMFLKDFCAWAEKTNYRTQLYLLLNLDFLSKANKYKK